MVSWRLEHRPQNREGHPSARPWRVLDGSGRQFRAYTSPETANAALAFLQAGTVPSKFDVYRRIGRYGPKSRNNRQSG